MRRTVLFCPHVPASNNHPDPSNLLEHKVICNGNGDLVWQYKKPTHDHFINIRKLQVQHTASQFENKNFTVLTESTLWHDCAGTE